MIKQSKITAYQTADAAPITSDIPRTAIFVRLILVFAVKRSPIEDASNTAEIKKSSPRSIKNPKPAHFSRTIKIIANIKRGAIEPTAVNQNHLWALSDMRGSDASWRVGAHARTFIGAIHIS